MSDLGYSLAGRSRLPRRAVVVGAGREELLQGLAALADGQGMPGVVEGLAEVDGRVAFVFPGQGSQWAGMAVELLDASPVFAAALRECGAALEEFVAWSLEDVLREVEGAPGLDGVDVVQPALFAVMVALARLWQACGVQPGVVVGHSQGEIAAAHIAGGLSLEDAARLVVMRSKLLVGLMGRGGMVSVALSEEELAPWLERWDGAVSVAAVNGPGSVVVSGERQALDGLLAELVEGGVRAREIPVGYASHSFQIEEIREELLQACEGIEPLSGSVPFLSTVTGEVMDTADLDAEYWFANLREPVRFEGATRRLLLDEGYRAFVEVSPHPVLTIGVQETVDDALGGGTLDGVAPAAAPGDAAGVCITGSLRREEGGLDRFLASLAEVWVRGVEVDWPALFAGSGARRIGLPSYAFQRERFWLDDGAGAGDVAAVGQFAAGHPLLGAGVGLAGDGGLLFTGRISFESHPWLAEHAVMGTVLLPGTAFVEMALRAGREVGCGLLEELVLEAPLTLAEHAVQLQVALGEPGEDGRRPIAIHSRREEGDGVGEGAEGGWTRHAEGSLLPSTEAGEGAATGGDADSGEPAGERAGALAGETALAGAWPPPARSRLPSRISTSVLPGGALNTAPSSRACTPPGSAGARCSPRSRCRRTRMARPSACTPRCWTRRCTRSD